MRVLFQSICMPAPHFETELELMADHIDRGDEVYAVKCSSKLATCFINPSHLKSECLRCQGKFDSGISQLCGKVNVLEYEEFAQSEFSCLQREFQTIDELKAYTVGTVQLGLCVASSLITRINREHRLDTHAYRNEILRELQTAWFVYLNFRSILSKYCPDRVYLFNGRFSTVLPAVNACEEIGVPFYTHERGGELNKYWLIRESTPHDNDYVHQEILDMWNELPIEDAELRGNKFYLDRRKRVEHSWISFTGGQSNGLLPFGFDNSKRNIGIFNSTIEEYAAVRNWPKPVRIYRDEIDAIEQIANSFVDDSSVHFYLRVHPNLKGYDNSQTREIHELGLRVKNVTIIGPESEIDSYALMSACTAVVTFGSTMGAEANYWGKPSILLGKAYYEKLDCAYAPSSHEETISLLNSELSPKPRLGSIQYGLWDLGRGIPFKRYQPRDLFAGEFLGTEISPSFMQKVVILVYRIIELKNPSAIAERLINRLKRSLRRK